MAVIFETVHGSHLYGMAHEGSDMDMFIVTDSLRSRARHSFNKETGIDTCTVGFGTFMARVFEGSHQSVEALFSPRKVWHSNHELAPLIEAYRVTGSNVFAKYERTIKSFCFGDFKRRRHAARLALNLADLRERGKFNPCMTRQQRDYAGLAAERMQGEELWEYLT